MSAEDPWEPNPLVPTVVYGFPTAESGDWLQATFGRSLSGEQPVWLLRSGAPPERTALGTLAERGIDGAEALMIPALEPEVAQRSLLGLRALVHRLRAPGGCPWDRAQTHESLIRYVIEEAYEVADAIRHEGAEQLAEELGDLLLQVFLHAELAEEAGDFTLDDVVARLATKLVSRHPHVFGGVTVANATDVERNWEQLKATEKPERTSALDGVARSLPALLAAQEIQRRLKKAGFDWPDRGGVERKLAEELAELASATPDDLPSELGDVLFALARLGLDSGADAEEALRGTNARVSVRFRYVEQHARERGRPVRELPLEELLALWETAKPTEAR